MPVGQPPPHPPHPGVQAAHPPTATVSQQLDASRNMFARRLQMATRGTEVTAAAQKPALIEEFARLYRMPAALGVSPAEAQRHMTALQDIAAGTPLADLGEQATRALGYLRQGAPPPPFRAPPASADPVAPSALQPSAKATGNAALPSAPRPAAGLQRREAVKGRRSAGRSAHTAPPSLDASANKENIGLLPNPWDRREAAPDDSLAFAQRAGAVVLNHPQVGEGFAPELHASQMRDVPVLTRPIEATDTLMTNAVAKRDGEGLIFVVDQAGKRFRLQGMRYLQAQDVAMVESTRLGGGAFGDFSVGLLAQKNAEPVLVAIKKMRTDDRFIGPKEIKTELRLQQKVCQAIAAQQALAEQGLSAHNDSPLKGVRSSFVPPKVYDAYFDDAKQQGFLLGSVADGDMQALTRHLLTGRNGALPSNRREAIVRSFIAQSGTQLDIMHKYVGVLHLDFKGANTLVDRSGQMTLNDFGLSMSVMNGQQSRYATIGSMPVPEMYRDVFGAKPGLSPKTDAFCLALSGLEMLAADTGVRLAGWRPVPPGAPPQARQIENVRFLNNLQEYLRQLSRGPKNALQIPRTADGRVNVHALPRLSDPQLAGVLNLCIERHPELTLSLLGGLHADRSRRSGAQQLAREAAAALPPVQSRLSREVRAALDEAATALAAQQPREQLQSMAVVLPAVT